MTDLKFEKVGDINFTYPYIAVYKNDSPNPFMDIGINDDKQLEFLFYESSGELKLSIEEMQEILRVANDFLPKAIADEESFQKFMKNSK
jgi:hypothetical protein